MPDAFGNALGQALAAGSGQTAGSSEVSEQLQPLHEAQRQALAAGYGPLTPEAANQVVFGQMNERISDAFETSSDRIILAGGNGVRELRGLGTPDSSYTPGDIGKRLTSALASLRVSITPDVRDFARYAEIRAENSREIQSVIQALNSDPSLRQQELELLPKVLNTKGLNDLTEYVKNTSIVNKDFAPTVFNALFSRQMDIGARAHFVANLPTEIVNQFGALAEVAANTPQTIDEHELVKSFGITIALAAEANRPFAAAAGLNALRAWDTIANRTGIVTNNVRISSPGVGSTGSGELTGLVNQIRESGGTLAIQRGQVTAQELAAASRATGNEFTIYRDRATNQLFVRELGTIGGEVPLNSRLIIHSQPGTTAISVIPSPADRAALQALDQRSSVIINETGEFGLRFGRTPKTDNSIVPLR